MRLKSPLKFPDGTTQNTAAAEASPAHGKVTFAADSAAGNNVWSSWTSASRWTTKYDSDGAFGATGTGIFTAPFDGLYTFTASGEWASSASGQRALRIVVLSAVSGSPVATNDFLAYDAQLASAALTVPRPNCVAQARLKAGDQIIPQFFQDSGGSLNNRAPVTNSVVGCWFTYKRESA